MSDAVIMLRLIWVLCLSLESSYRTWYSWNLISSFAYLDIKKNMSMFNVHSSYQFSHCEDKKLWIEMGSHLTLALYIGNYRSKRSMWNKKTRRYINSANEYFMKINIHHFKFIRLSHINAVYFQFRIKQYRNSYSEKLLICFSILFILPITNICKYLTNIRLSNIVRSSFFYE